ncbi:RsmB/NOP family class I SAM-dependent RNA methyltransferase [Marivivens marinus]|uniref:RsmB/NOP family class I SAM-dependent RNA methyltransferase n=1 Tax=Marivivens marinus TaxID=3110173 RepID=UPI003B8457BB
MTKPDKSGLAPRYAAYQLIEAVTGEGRLLPELIGAGALARLDPQDRARAQRIAMETLRALDRADRMLKPFMAKRPPLPVRNALRMGTVEIWAFGEAPHGVVNACVEIIGRDPKHRGMKGLVNAVLRKVAEERPGAWDRLPTPRLPDWLRDPMIAAWGKPAVAAMEEAHYKGAALDLTPKGDAETLAAQLGGAVLPTGSVRLADAGQVSQLPGYDAGHWWVQDAAAALPARILNATPGEKVLDLCAAPGGKTMQLAAAGADVTAVDVSDGRMTRVGQNLARTGLNARTVVADAFDFDEAGWDAILLDAPCSATGTIRRHPDLPRAKDGSEFGALIDQQEALIDHALSLLKPGGRLMFCTCSLLPDEGEVQVEEALSRHPGLTVEGIDTGALGVDPAWITEEGGLRLRPDYWPELGGMDGFYMALLRKPA